MNGSEMGQPSGNRAAVRPSQERRDEDRWKAKARALERILSEWGERVDSETEPCKRLAHDGLQFNVVDLSNALYRFGQHQEHTQRR